MKHADKQDPRASAFTLIEVMLAVLVMAMLVGVAMLSFRAPLERARSQDAVEMVRSLDFSTRAEARRFSRDLRIVFDLGQQKVARQRSDGEHEVTYQASIPSAARIDEVRVGGRRFTEGEAIIACSSMGLTRTYAVHLAGANLDRWVVVAGLSGDVRTIENESAIDSILQPLASRDDVD